MPPRPRRAGAAVLTTLILAFVTACQATDPDPIPTATLPTPVQPTPSPTTEPTGPTADPTDRLSEDEAAAIGAYLDGRAALDTMLSAGGDPDSELTLKDYFSGIYLDSLVALNEQYMTEVESQTGSPDPVAYVQLADRESAETDEYQFVSCLDFSSVSTKLKTGETVDRGFEVSVDTVTMRMTDRWRADAVSSQPADSFDGTECPSERGQ